MKWNEKIQLIISDVDETIAGLYIAAKPEMIAELEKLLIEGKILFLISGQSVQSMQWRIVDKVRKDLRKNIVMGHCSGAEVWGFDKNGDLNKKPFYSLYETKVNDKQKKVWRDIVSRLIDEFRLKVLPTMPIPEFEKRSQGDPKTIMFEDRGPQITFEVVNGFNLTEEQVKKVNMDVPKVDNHYDLRIAIVKRAGELLKEKNLPITPRIAGVFAIDFAVEGVSKTTAVKYVVENDSLLQQFGLTKSVINSENIEVWGDKFSALQGGTDRYMSEALPKEVRSVSFREENPKEFPKGYNIVVWEGKNHLQDGLLEFLQSR